MGKKKTSINKKAKYNINNISDNEDSNSNYSLSLKSDYSSNHRVINPTIIVNNEENLLKKDLKYEHDLLLNEKKEETNPHLLNLINLDYMKDLSSSTNKNIENNKDNHNDELDLEVIEKKNIEEAHNTGIVEFKDFYEVDYNLIHNFHKKV